MHLFNMILVIGIYLIPVLGICQTLEPHTEFWTHGDLVMGNTLSMSLGLVHDFDDLACATKQLSGLRIFVHFDHGENYDQGGAEHFAELDLTIRIMSGASLVQTGTAEFNSALTISEENPESYYELEGVDISTYTQQPSLQMSQLEVDINGYQYTNTTSLPLENAYRFWIEFIPEFTVDVDETTTSAILSQNAPVQLSTGKYRFSWNPCGFQSGVTSTTLNIFPGYQFQLLKLENTIMDLGSDPYSSVALQSNIPGQNGTPFNTISTEIDWTNALDVYIGDGQTYIDLTLTEGEGYYLWRVRPIGNSFPNDVASPQNWGPWTSTGSLTDNGTVQSVTSSMVDDYLIYVGNGPYLYDDLFDKNWIHGRVMTEGTSGLTGVRSRETMTFANGLQQVQQEQTRLSSQDNIVLNQTIYDHLGRPSLKTLPVPVSGSAGLGYLNHFATQSPSTNFTASDFDNDAGTTGAWDSPSTMEVLASNPLSYYKGNLNADPLIPDAEGYPYTRTVFAADNTGRVKYQSGAGAVFKMGGLTGIDDDRTVRTFYAQSTDHELVRVFGNEAPAADAVYKKITVDPNQVMSVEYIDKAGRTLATCLSDATEHLALEKSGQGSADFSPPNYVEVTRSGAYSFHGSAPITVAEAQLTLKLLEFNLQPGEVSTCLLNTWNICTTCDYDVFIEIVNAVTGEVVPIPGLTNPISNVSGMGSDCDGQTIDPLTLPQNNQDIDVTLDQGEYYINLEIVSNNTFVGPLVTGTHLQQLLLEYEDDLIAAFDQQFGNNINDYLDPDDGSAPDPAGFLSAIGAPACDPEDPQPVVVQGDASWGNCAPEFEIPCVNCPSGCDGLNDYFGIENNEYAEYFYSYWREQLGAMDDYADFEAPADCQMMFNPTLITELGPLSQLLQDATTNDNGDQAVYFTVASGNASWSTTAQEIFGGRTADQFNTLIATLYGTCTAPECCQSFWGCWQGLVAGYANMECNVLSIPPSDANVSYEDAGTSNPGVQHVDVVNELIQCLDAWDTQWITADESTAMANPQQYIYYPDPVLQSGEVSSLESCLNSYAGRINVAHDAAWAASTANTFINGSGNQVSLDTWISQSDFSAYINGINQVSPTANEEDFLNVYWSGWDDVPQVALDMTEAYSMYIEGFRGCLESALPLEIDPDDPVAVNGMLDNGIGGTLDQCKDRCDSRLGSFQTGIVDMYHYHGISVQGDAYFLTNETVFDPDPEGLGPNDPQPEEYGVTEGSGYTLNYNDAVPNYQTCDWSTLSIPSLYLPNSTDPYTSPTGDTWVPMSDVECAAQGLLLHCYDMCETAIPPIIFDASNDPVANPTGWADYLQGYYESLDQELFSDIMSANFELDLPDPDCPNDPANPFTAIQGGSVPISTQFEYSGVDAAYRSPNLDIAADGVMLNGYLYLGGSVLNELASAYEWTKPSWTSGTGTNSDAWLVRVDPADPTVVLDAWSYGGESTENDINDGHALDGHDYIIKVLENNGLIYLVGQTNSKALSLIYGCDCDLHEDDTHQLENDLWVMCVNEQGQVQWGKTYGGVGLELAIDAQISGDELIMLALSKSEAEANPVSPYDGKYSSASFEGVDYAHAWILGVNIANASTTLGAMNWDHAIGYYLNQAHPSMPFGSLTENASIFPTALHVNGNSVLVASISVNGTTNTASVLHQFQIDELAPPPSNNFINNTSPVAQRVGSYTDPIYDIADAHGGGYILAGVTQSPSSDFNLLHWQSQDLTLPDALPVSYRGSVLQGGSTQTSDLWLVKVDHSLDYVWDKCFGSDVNEGYNFLAPSVQTDVNFLWSHIVRVHETDQGRLVVVTSAEKTNQSALTNVNRTDPGAYDLNTPLSGTAWDYWVVQTDEHGNYVTDFTLGGYYTDGINSAPNDFAGAIIDLENGNLAVLGTSYSSDNSSNPSVGERTWTNGGKSDYWMTILSPEVCQHDDICFRWVDPPVFESDFTLEPVTCEGALAEAIINSLETQKQAYIESQLEALRQDFVQNCIENMEHTFSYSYPLGYRHYTLYYYDRAGNLIKTVPPEGVDLLDVDSPNAPDAYDPTLATSSTATRNIAPQHRMVTEYYYNSLGQLVRQETPDGGETHFMYNGIGQLRFSQNAQQAIDQEYAYTKYDNLGRVIQVGKLQGSMSLTNANDINFPTTDGDEWVKTTYSVPGPTSMSQEYLQNRVSYTENYKGIKTFYSYDPHGNVTRLSHDLNDPLMDDVLIEYEYDLISGNVLSVHYQPGQRDEFTHRYSYDEDNRIVKVETSTDGVLWDTDATYEYYAHGPLKRTILGEDKVQGTDYVYTLQGWLKGINHPDFTLNGNQLTASLDPSQDGMANSDVARDAFSMMLHYHDADFTKLGSPFANPTNSIEVELVDDLLDPNHPTNGANLYNGNIGAWVSNLDVSSIDPQDYFGSPLQAWSYRYDDLNRIKYANYNERSGGVWDLTANNDFSSSFNYDGNGNLMTLSRNSIDVDQSNGVQNMMDQLSYSYPEVSGLKVSNRLEMVHDAVDETTQNDQQDDIEGYHHYEYDAIGNLVKEYGSSAPSFDPNTDELMTVNWNLQGKVASVERPSYSNAPEITFTYDAQGNRVKKKVQPANTDTYIETFYVRDAQGNIMAVYDKEYNDITEGNEMVLTLKERPLYGSSRVGENRTGVVIKHQLLPQSGNPVTVEPEQEHVADQRLMPVAGVFEAISIIQAADHWDVSSSVASSSGISSGALGYAPANTVVGETRYGQKVFTAVICRQEPLLNSFFGGSPSVLLYGPDGLLMDDFWDMIADPNSSALAMESPNSPDFWYLFTMDAQGHVYYHVIDVLNNRVEQKNIELFNSQNGNEETFSRGMALVADYSSGSSRLYVKKDGGTEGELYSLEISSNTFISNPSVDPALLNLEVRYPTSGSCKKSEVQISPDGSKIAFVGMSEKKQLLLPRLFPYSMLRNSAREAILVYQLDADHHVYPPPPVIPPYAYWNQTFFSEISASYSLSSNSRLVNSFDFTADGNIYFRASALGSFGLNANGDLLRRWNIGSSADDIYQGQIGEVRRGANGNMYAPVYDPVRDPVGPTGFFWRPNYNALLEVPDPDQTAQLPTVNTLSVASGISANVSNEMRLQPHRIYPLDVQRQRSLGHKYYELTDHLGNVRSVITDWKLSDVSAVYDPAHVGDPNYITDYLASNFRSDVLSVSNFYPFGSIMPGRSFNSNSHRYSFNGYERDDEIKGSGNSINFGARMLDTRLGRFMSLDPYSRLSTGVSLYSFAGNSPILFIDFDGNFKYPKGSTQEKDYPKLTNYLKNSVQEIANNPTIIKALAEYGQISEADVKKALTWGEGPTINVTPLKGANGEFSPGIGSDELRINTKIVEQLENATGDDRDAALLLVGSTILHEYTHYGDDQDGKDYPGEEGQKFEEKVYGRDIDNLEDAKKTLNEYNKRHSSDGSGSSTGSVTLPEVTITPEKDESTGN